MNQFCKIKFKNKEYEINSILDFNSFHSNDSNVHNIYEIITDEMPQGLITAITTESPISAFILDESIWRPKIEIATTLDHTTKQLQYTITIRDKGE